MSSTECHSSYLCSLDGDGGDSKQCKLIQIGENLVYGRRLSPKAEACLPGIFAS